MTSCLNLKPSENIESDRKALEPGALLCGTFTARNRFQSQGWHGSSICKMAPGDAVFFQCHKAVTYEGINIKQRSKIADNFLQLEFFFKKKIWLNPMHSIPCIWQDYNIAVSPLCTVAVKRLRERVTKHKNIVDNQQFTPLCQCSHSQGNCTLLQTI